MRDSVPSASYSSVCNVLRQWSISLIPTYRVYLLYDIIKISSSDCNYISRLYLYISGCIYLYISGCIYISPAVFIYLQLYIYKEKNILKNEQKVGMLL